jgi:ectoine hydroxylase-related dioxygenase (phytanoyl-CoA dioxygenase family)
VSGPVPVVDARRCDGLDPAAADAFRAHGALVIRGLLHPDELEALRRETGALVERALRERVGDFDFQYRKHPATGEETPSRIEYVVDKTGAGKALLGHPFVLRSVERLQGREFVPTWDSLVFKAPGAGAVVEWHRDADATQCLPGVPIFNVDVYLDPSDETNGLYVLPGSNRWTDAEAAAEVERRNAGGAFDTAGAVPVPMQAGDALLHDILLVHGSPPSTGPLRRVIYLEFRPVEAERRLGPHTDDYLPLKQAVLRAALRARATAPWAAGEAPYAYAALDPESGRGPAEEPAVRWRVPHHEHWRALRSRSAPTR